MTQTSSSPKIPLIDISSPKPDLRKAEPPLVSLQVSNPITYLKSWWKKILGNEGIDFRFRIHPLTAVALTIIIATCGFGLGRFSFVNEKPYIKYVPLPTPTPSPWVDPYRQAAFSGKLQFSDPSFYLVTSSAEAIKLEVPENVNLQSMVGRRIFATGKYNQQTNILIVSQATDLEILPKKTELIPLITPKPQSATDSGQLD